MENLEKSSGKHVTKHEKPMTKHEKPMTKDGKPRENLWKTCDKT